MDLGLEGKVAIVTGATANIGRGIALELAANGVKLVAVGRDTKAGASVVAKAKELGAADAIFVAADMLDHASPARILSAAEALGPLDVLVNNVGGNVDQGFFVDSDPNLWLGDIDLNFGTVLRMTHAVLPGMIAMIQATEAIKLLLGIGQPLTGRLLVYDALALQHELEEVRLKYPFWRDADGFFIQT